MQLMERRLEGFAAAEGLSDEAFQQKCVSLKADPAGKQARVPTRPPPVFFSFLLTTLINIADKCSTFAPVPPPPSTHTTFPPPQPGSFSTR